jgi:hypothetical protein
MADQKEQFHRKHSRLNIELAVELSVPAGHRYQGKTTDISFGGVKANFPDDPGVEVGDDVMVSVSIEKLTGEQVVLQLNCRITQKVDSNNICLQFHRTQRIDREAYNQFKKFMILHCSDAEELLEELFNDTGIIISHGNETG